MPIASASGAYLAEIGSLPIATSGVHTILAMDNAGTHTGDYCLHAQRLNNPGQAMPIGFGEVLCETIWPLSETDAFTFDASAGDLILIRMVATANVFMDPHFRVYDSAGQFITNASGAYYAETSSLPVPAGGQYTILAMDAAGDHGGDYCIHIQRLNEPAHTTGIAFYDVLCNTITSLSQTDAYVFAAEAGDVIRITMSASANVFMDPEIRLYNPSGMLVASATHAYFAVIDNLLLQESGVFTVLAMDVQGDDGGDYCVSLICLSPPCGPPPPLIYCTAKANSLGCTPAIGYSGLPSTSNPSPFDITAIQVINNKNGIFFYGLSGRHNLPFQGGILCVKPPTKRTPVQNSSGNPPPPDCSGTFSFDFNAWMQGGSDPNLAVGVQVNGQYWYRDPASPSTTGLTDAIEFTVRP